jgi:hypothetical protein
MIAYVEYETLSPISRSFAVPIDPGANDPVKMHLLPAYITFLSHRIYSKTILGQETCLEGGHYGHVGW